MAPVSPQLIYIADVFCPWCYAFMPVMKRLADENPDIPIKVLGGNLISRPITLAEDVAQSPDLVDFWHEVERMSGRSLAGAIGAVETGRDVRLFSPGADEILAVLHQMAPGHELAQLFELEEIFYGQGRDMFTDEALAEIASRWQIDPGKFERAFDKAAAFEATERNLQLAAQLMGEIGSYPSVILRNGELYYPVSRGYVHYETVEARFADAMRELNMNLEDSVFCSLHHGCSLRRR